MRLTKICLNLFAPPYTPDYSGKVGLNLAMVWLLPVGVVRLHFRDLHAVGWREGI